jgi:hypothetical protein
VWVNYLHKTVAITMNVECRLAAYLVRSYIGCGIYTVCSRFGNSGGAPSGVHNGRLKKLLAESMLNNAALTAGMKENHAIEQLERDRRNHKQIDRSDSGCVIAQECRPALGRWSSAPDHVPADG